MNSGGAERRFVVSHDLDGGDGGDYFVTCLNVIREGGFVDIERQRFTHAESDEGEALLFFSRARIRNRARRARIAVVGQNQGGIAASGACRGEPV